jgi:hypothetical protein
MLVNLTLLMIEVRSKELVTGHMPSSLNLVPHRGLSSKFFAPLYLGCYPQRSTATLAA